MGKKAKAIKNMSKRKKRAEKGTMNCILNTSNNIKNAIMLVIAVTIEIFVIIPFSIFSFF